MEKCYYAVIRIDYENVDGTFDADEEGAVAADIVVENALAHAHTIENGIKIINVTNCGESI